MKAILGLMVLVILIYVAGVTQALPSEYNRTDSGYDVFLSTPSEILLSPKVSCAQSSIGVFVHCGMLYYDNSTNQVIMGLSYDEFNTVTFYNVETVDYKDFDGTKDLENSSSEFTLPLDIHWNDVLERYEIITARNSYTFDISGNVLTNTFTQPDSIVNLNINSNDRILALNMVNVGGTYVVNITGYDVDTGTEKSSPAAQKIFVTTLTNVGANSCLAATGFLHDNNEEYLYHITFTTVRTNSGCGSSGTQFNLTETDLGNYAINTDVPDYFDGSNFVARNSSLEAIYRTESSNMVTFASRNLYYLMPANEIIQQQDSYQDTGGRIVAFINNTVGRNELIIYSQVFTPVTVLNTLANYNTLSTVTSNATVRLNCNIPSYNETKTGSIFDMRTPCEITTSTVTSSNIPSVFSYNFNIGSCNSILLSHEFSTVSSVLYRVIDSVSGAVIPNANVRVGSVIGTTDSNGEVTISIQPISSSDFKATQTGCTLRLQSSGNQSNLLTYTNIYTASGYDTTVETGVTYPRSLTSKVISLARQGTRANVKVYTSDGFEIKPSGVTITAQADDTNVLIIDGNSYRNQSTWNTVPVTFFFSNTSATDTVLAKFNYTHTDGQVFTRESNLTFGSNTDVQIFINTIAKQTYCNAVTDCAQTFCSASVFSQLIGCTQNTCTYTSEQCKANDLCSDSFGCFDIRTTDTCTDDGDCTSSCTGSYTSNTQFCDDGFCIGKIISCGGSLTNSTLLANQCNPSSGLCKSTEACMIGGFIAERFSVYEVPEYQGVLGEVTQLGVDNLKALFGFNVTNNITAYIDTQVTCGFGNRDDISTQDPQGFITLHRNIPQGKSICISGASFPDFDDKSIIARPSNWLVTRENDVNFVKGQGSPITGTYDKLIFHDVSVSCARDLTCQINYEFCKYGCFQGQCLDQPLDDSKDAANSALKTTSSVLASFLPDPMTKMVFSLMGMVFWIGIGAYVARNHWQIGALMGVVWLVLMMFVSLEGQPMLNPVVAFPMALILVIPTLISIASRFSGHGGSTQ